MALDPAPPSPSSRPRRREAAAGAPLLIGCDFTSSPSRRKPVVVALGQLAATTFSNENRHFPASTGHVVLLKLEYFDALDAFAAWLCAERQAWVGGFDLPFGLPRELVEHLGWPLDWGDCIRHFSAQPRAALRQTFAAFCAARPVGAKFAHRATDRPAGSSPSMKWVNPPVAWMLHAGVPLLLAAQAHLPGLHPGRPDRVALEAYPGLLARELLCGTGRPARRSYKSDDPAGQTPARQQAREDLLRALAQGQTRLGLRLRLSAAQRDQLANDPRGDQLDAVLCLMQAAWAVRQHAQGPAEGPGWGLPAFDPLEGWIVTA